MDTNAGEQGINWGVSPRGENGGIGKMGGGEWEVQASSYGRNVIGMKGTA